MGGLLIALAAAVTSLGWVDVEVYVDRDGDGRRGAGEEAVPYAVVGAGTQVAVTDDTGRARLAIGDGLPVWARGFDGFAVPGPWARARPGAIVELGMRPLAPPSGPWRFVVAADAHFQRPGEPLGAEGDLETSLVQATAGEDPPRFVIVAGDLMQNADPDEAAGVAHVFATRASPLVAVPGNHDWYDDGALWRARFGPDLYSFDLGGVHVIALNSMRPVHELLDFVRADLASVGADQRVIAVTHGPPEFELAEPLDALGVEAVFAGHWHVNRVLHRGGALVELDTEPWVMGGMDQTPAGYRVVEVTRPPFAARASLDVRHYTTTELPIVSLVGPVPGQCVAPGAPIPIVVALAGGADLEPVRATVEGAGGWIELAPAGGWDWIGTLPALDHGVHKVTLRAGRSKRDTFIDVCAPPRFRDPGPASWPQFGGGPERHSATARSLSEDLAPRWIRAVGGHLGAGSPIVAGGLVIVTTADLADDRRSAVVALELATGEERWRFRSGAAVRNAAAADDGVVIAAASDGVVYGLDLATGDVRWRVDLGARVLPEHRAIWGAPLIAGGLVFTGNQRRFAAIELRTGAIRWEVDPVPDTDGGGSFASPTLADGVIVTIANRLLSGVQGWEPATGRALFQSIDACSLSAAASPVADGSVVHVISGAGERCTVELPRGDDGSWGPLDREGFEWAYEVAATPAFARDTLVAVTQYGEAFAFDTREERLAWARPVGTRAAIHPAHYRAGTAAIAATPVIAGDAVWIGTASGDVIAVDLATGRDRAMLHVGAPVLSGLAVAGDSLIVASYDGTVRVYSPPPRRVHVWTLLAELAGVIALYGGLALLARRRDLRQRPGRRAAA